MVKLTIRPTKRPSLSLSVPESKTLVLGGSLGELEAVGFEIAGLEEPQDLKLLVGDIPVLPPDGEQPRPTFPPEGGYGFYWPKWIYFERWAGYCTLSFVDADNPDCVVCNLDVLILPAKVTADELNQLVDDLASVEIGLILDVYGKTNMVLSGQKPLIGVAPEFFLTKAEEMIAAMKASLPELRRRPHTGYRSELLDERPLAASSLTPAQVSWLSRRPSGLRETVHDDPNGFRVAARTMAVTRVPSSETVKDLDTYEHRALRWFLQRLRRGLLTLRELALDEHARREGATHHYWHTEDAPRLGPLMERARQCAEIIETLDTWLRREPLLVEARSFVPPLRPTATFRRQRAYRRLYDAMRTFGDGGEFRFSGPGERYKTQNLSVLFEYWASLKVFHYLSSRFELVTGDLASIVDTNRYILTMQAGFCARFRTSDGRWIRYRYEPSYVALGTPNAKFGRLARNTAPWCPDMAFEICQLPNQQVPDFMLVFDVKYKRQKQEPALEDLLKTASKYLNTIGRFDTFEQIVKHSWIIYPSDRTEPWTESPLFEPAPPKAMRTMGFIPILPGFDTTFVRTMDRLLEFEGLLPTTTKA